MVKLFYCDTETTGTNPQIHGIHQLSFIIEYVNADGSREIKERINMKIKPNPTLVIDTQALEVSGITQEMIDTYTDEETSFRQLKSILKKYVNSYNKQDKMIFIGYNVGFDVQFVRELFIRNGDNYYGSMFWSNPIDVMTLAGIRLLNSRHEMANFQLMTVASQLGINVNVESAHDALYDIDVTREMYLMLWGGGEKTKKIDSSNISARDGQSKSKLLSQTKLDEINAVTGTKSLNKVDSENFTFSFGKHNGMTIAQILEVNPSYIIWAHDNCIKGLQFSQKIMDKAIKENEKAKEKFSKKDRYPYQYDGNTVDHFFDNQYYDECPF